MSEQLLTVAEVLAYEAGYDARSEEVTAEIARLTAELEKTEAALTIAKTTAANLHDVIRRKDRELEEAREREEWRPIDTAPRDGTQVLLTGVGLDRWISTGRWVNGHWYDDDGPGWLANVTHWMPLPAPPREENDA